MIEDSPGKVLGVAVLTPVGTFPNEDDLRRVAQDEKISTILALAAAALKLTNTTDWVASVNDRPIDPAKTFGEEYLSCVVEIEWHKPEGGGGA
jgi:hypothetical protein